MRRLTPCPVHATILTDRGVAQTGQRAWFGTTRSPVQIRPPRPCTTHGVHPEPEFIEWFRARVHGGATCHLLPEAIRVFRATSTIFRESEEIVKIETRS